MKIVVLDGYVLNPGDLSWDSFAKLGDFVCYDRTQSDEILERCDGADAIITNKTPITRQTLEACPSIKYIGVLATGYNIVDVEAAKDKGIPVTNVPTYGTNAVAQFVFSLLLEICSHVAHHSNTVKELKWSNSIDFSYWDYPLIELHGLTMGIVGFGRIGRATAKIAEAFGMKVLVYSRTVYDNLETENLKFVSFDELCKNSDVISLHLPLFPATEGMINKDSISKMKEGVIVINTSRGALVVEDDMYEALSSGKVGWFAADVVSTEPISPDNVLLGAPNCFLTPHIAWAPKAARQRLMDTASGNLASFIDGEPENVVNP